MLFTTKKIHGCNLAGSLSMKIIPESSKHSINVSSGQKTQTNLQKKTPNTLGRSCFPREFLIFVNPRNSWNHYDFCHTLSFLFRNTTQVGYPIPFNYKCGLLYVASDKSFQIMCSTKYLSGVKKSGNDTISSMLCSPARQEWNKGALVKPQWWLSVGNYLPSNQIFESVQLLCILWMVSNIFFCKESLRQKNK